MKGRTIHEAGDGSLWLLKPEGQIEQAIVKDGVWEFASTRIVRQLRLKPGDVVVDVGANIGWYSVLCGRAGARVHAFDPNPQSLQLCRVHLALNGVVDATCTQAAVDNYGLGTAIDSLRLDSLRLLKVDTDGCELGIVRGALRTLDMFHPVICIEIDDWSMAAKCSGDKRPEPGEMTRELCRLLQSVGYRVFWERGLEEIDADGAIAAQRKVEGTINVFCATSLEALKP